MKIIIDLDEKYYNDIKNSPTASNYSTLYALFGIRNGTPLSEELEKIKAEIEEIDNIVHEHGATYINKYGIVKVFNSHISELKGENK